MSRPVVVTMDLEDMVNTRAGAEEMPERTLALAVIHQAIVDLTTRPTVWASEYRRRKFAALRHGAALFLVGDPTRQPKGGTHLEMRTLWCGMADVNAAALESRLWKQHGALLRHVLDHPPETPRSKWREIMRRRRLRRMRRAKAAA